MAARKWIPAGRHMEADGQACGSRWGAIRGLA